MEGDNENRGAFPQPDAAHTHSNTVEGLTTAETSQLPVRSSNTRAHSTLSRSSPYTVTHSNVRHMTAGDVANIPRTAQYHAVGMPARHPLGVQSESMHSDVSSTESVDSNVVDYSEPVVTAAPLGTRADVNVGDSGTTEMVDEDEDVGEGQALLTPLGLLDGGEESSVRGEDGGSGGHADGTNGSSRANSLSDSRPRGTFDRRGVNGFPERRQITLGGRIAGSHKQLQQQQQPASSPIILGGSGGSLGCPICLGTICEAFMTACGHSFCYHCISRHLLERRTCPTCQQPLEGDQIFPNFTLNKLITHGSPDIKPLTGSKSQQQQQQQRVSSILDQVRSSVETGDGLDSEDIDTLLTLLQQKKQAMRSYKRQFEMATMRQFLLTAQAKKAGEMEALRKELTVVEEDLDFVSTQLDGFAQSSETFNDGARARECAAIAVCGKKNQMAEGAQVPNNAPLSADETALLPRNKRVEEHFADLESFYFNTRMRGVGEEGLDEFLETLTTFARHEKFRPVATLRYGDSTASTAIVASIEFDRDDEIFAVAGVTRKIKIYDYGNVIEQAEAWSELAQYQQQKRGRQQQQQQQHSQDWWNREVEAGSTSGGGGGDDSGMMATALQYPVAEFTNRSKISCLSFNPYIKSQLACSDYDGTVSLWDVGVGTSTLSLGEHEKRAWSVDFSHVDPTRLCSGSDDGKVKIWTTNRRASVMTIEGKANVCCVRFNPLHGNILSFGSADHNVHCFDLRSPKQPLCVLRGHRKAVSYTRFLSPDEIISASTDSSLKLWSLRTQECVRTFSGHANEKNFVGLTTSGGDWIACGSENNTMYAYYRNLSHPAVTYKFGNCNPVTGIEQPEEDPSLFVSAVCWKNKSNTMLSANSQGIIKVLELE